MIQLAKLIALCMFCVSVASVPCLDRGEACAWYGSKECKTFKFFENSRYFTLNQRECLAWNSSEVAKNFTFAHFGAKRGEVGNTCQNPFWKLMDAPWCYTWNANKTEINREYCYADCARLASCETLMNRVKAKWKKCHKLQYERKFLKKKIKRLVSERKKEDQNTVSEEESKFQNKLKNVKDRYERCRARLPMIFILAKFCTN